jgi:tetratricopeptide (TPR) repeat protein
MILGRLYAVFIFLLLCIYSDAQDFDDDTQNKIDSIQNEISLTSDDSVKVSLLLDWSFIVYATHPHEDFHINKKIEKICRENLKKKLSVNRKKHFNICLIEALNNIGGNLMDYGDYKNAILYHTEALNLCLKNKVSKQEAASYTGLGNVYGDMGDHEKSIQYYRKSLNIHLKNNSLEQAAAVYNNLGLEASYRKRQDSAIYYYEKSLKYTAFEDFPYDYLTTLNNIASVYFDLKQDEKAIYSYEKCIRVSDSMHYDDLKSLALNNLANIYFELKNYDKAEQLYIEAEVLAIKSQTILNSIDANTGLYDLYKLQGKTDKAIICLERKILLQDSIYNQETKNLAMQEAFQLDYDRLRIQDSIDAARKDEFTKLEIKSKNEQLENEKNKQLFFFSGIGLVILFAGFMYNRFRVTRKQKGIIEEQKLIVEEKQKEIIDSISYARRIQKAILPSDKLFNELFPDNFVLYQPKDIVAGDFYWLEKTETHIFLAVCDCTGHGVPGAMVSVVCHNALNRSVKEFGLTDPGKILDKTRELVISEFEKSEEEVKDGMDISLLSISLSPSLSSRVNPTKENSYRVNYPVIHWAGANNPLWIIRNKQCLSLKPDKQPIGKFFDEKPFTTHLAEIQQGDKLYLFTDGFADQFGGDKGKKLKESRLKEILIDWSEKSFKEQDQELRKYLSDWKGNLEQVDDVCIIGIRILR